MFSKKTLIITASVATGLLLTACTSNSVPSRNSYIYNGVNFGSDRDATFKLGVQDGCKTSDGDYTKNHNLFNSSESYKVGWQNGRLKCKGK